MCALYLAVIVTAVIAYKTVFIEIVVEDPWFGVYSVVVCAFIMSRFLFSLFYQPVPRSHRQTLEPTVAVVMPAFNEEDAVADSIAVAARPSTIPARSSRSSSSTTAPRTAPCARSSGRRGEPARCA